jgi:hypothetical protein
MWFRRCCSLVAYLSLACVAMSCASVRSTSAHVNGSQDGLRYFMPKKDLLITIKVEAPKPQEVTIATTDAYPDLSDAYVLRQSSYLLGKNVTEIAVSTSGLLTSAHSSVTSGLPALFESIGKVRGAVTSNWMPDPAQPTCADGTHVFRLAFDQNPPAKPPVFCGLAVAIKKLNPTAAAGRAETHIARTDGSGVFYRQAEPFLISVAGGANAAAPLQSSVVFSPSLADTHYLPISRTFFADNTADFGFVDGMPTKFNQTREGELIAALKLPASIVSAYFSAVGGIFANFKTKDTGEADALKATVQLELARQKSELCLTAIREGNATAIKDLECGK